MNAERQASEMEMCRGGAGGCARVRGRGGRRRESLLTTRGKTRKKKDVMMMMRRSYSRESRLKVFFFLKSSPHLLSAGHVVQKSSHLLGEDEGQQRAVLELQYSRVIKSPPLARSHERAGERGKAEWRGSRGNYKDIQ